MELFKGATPVITLDVPSSAQQVLVAFYLDEEEVGNIVSPVVSGTTANVQIPYAAVEEEGTLRLEVQFMEDYTYYTKNYYYEVVTPYLQINEIKRLVNPTMTDQEAVDLERAVRLVIDSHTGQTFGYRRKTLKVRGRNDNPLQLPERLDVFESIVTSAYPSLTILDGYLVQDDGWSLRRAYVGANVYDVTLTTVGPIFYPWGYFDRDFVDPVVYSVTGYWGHRRVPEKVSEAARLLVNDYACSEQMYRDRYLVSMTAADWRIQFGGGAYTGTGNLRADQLLGDFVRTGWAVI